MNILGYNFYSDDDTFLPYCDLTEVLDHIVLQNGVFDEIMATQDLLDYTKPLLDTWDSSTILHAFFDDSLLAGSMHHSVDVITSVRLKRRKVGEEQWMTIYESVIKSVEDFTFTYVDRYAAYGDYEYCVVPCIGDAEQSYSIVTVESRFDGIILCDKNVAFQSIADASIGTVSRNRPSAVVTTLENKYPFVVYNGSSNYESGSVSGIFAEIDWEKKQFKIDNIPLYSKTVMDFLTNGSPKILKKRDGRIWMVDIVGTPSASVDGHPNKIVMNFEFVEIGDTNSSTDMYDNNFIDVNIERS